MEATAGNDKLIRGATASGVLRTTDGWEATTGGDN